MKFNLAQNGTQYIGDERLYDESAVFQRCDDVRTLGKSDPGWQIGKSKSPAHAAKLD